MRTALLAPRWASRLLAAAASAALAGFSGPGAGTQADEPQPPLRSAPVSARGQGASTAYPGVVEALRQTTVAAQVPGAVVALAVRAGDEVRAGQVLVRLDARAADQTAAAGAAQARAARAALDVAARDVERQRQLLAQGFISPAALDRAQALFKTAQAETAARLASAGAATSQSDLHVVRAPYGGVVAGVSVVLGDMALPGRPLLTLYDPAALRVSAAIPHTALAGQGKALLPEVEIPGVAAGRVKPVRVQRLPTVDAASHTIELRLDLPAHTPAAPGMFARAWLPGGAAGAGAARLFVPARALVRQAELAAVYVVGATGRPALRLVRPGRGEGDEVEVLAGVAAGEQVALDPQAAARMR